MTTRSPLTFQPVDPPVATRPASGARRAPRALKIDLTPPHAGDPLAPIAPWGVQPTWPNPDPAASQGGSPTLSEMVDRASAQLVILRKAVEEAGVADRSVRQHALELAQRVQQGQRFAQELDQRLSAAGRAAGMLEKATGALTALEKVLEQMRSAQAAVSRGIEQRLEKQQQEFDRLLREQQARFQRRLSEIESASEQAVRASHERAERTIAEAERRGEDIARKLDELSRDAEAVIEERRRAIQQQVDQAVAAADRQAAQVQARVSLVLDGASERLDLLEQQGKRLGVDAQEAIDALCERAALVLGHDPRSSFSTPPRPGSLADAVSKGESVVREVDDAGLRIAACRGEAMSVMDRLLDAVQQGRQVVELGEPALAELRASMERAMIEGQRACDALGESTRAQRHAAEQADRASELLSRQRDDLSAVAEASRYHVEQCRAAEVTLRATLADAEARGPDLERSAREVRREAERLVQLAREAAEIARRASAELGDDAQ